MKSRNEMILILTMIVAVALTAFIVIQTYFSQPKSKSTVSDETAKDLRKQYSDDPAGFFNAMNKAEQQSNEKK